MATVPVRYIGDKVFKKDTVSGTLTVWRGKGDVQEVDEQTAVRLLQHPSVWIDGKLPWNAKKGKLPPPKWEAPPPPVTEDEQDPVDESPEPPADEPQADVVKTPASVEQVVEAMSRLNRDTDMTEQGKPRADAVRGLLPDHTVNIDTIKAAWKKFSGE